MTDPPPATSTPDDGRGQDRTRLGEPARGAAAHSRELRRDEAYLRAVVETAVDAIITIDSRGLICSFNPAAEEIFGTSARQMLGEDVSRLMPEPEASQHSGYLRSYLETGRRAVIGIGREVRARRSDGSEFPAHIWVSEVELDGELLFVGFLRDLSEQKRLHAEYLQAQKMEAVGRLAGGIAHDFNNLLAGILGGLHIALQDIAPDHPSHDLLSEVEQEAERGASIVRRLLKFSRTQEARPRAIDPDEAARAAEPMLRRLLGEDIEVEVAYGAGGLRVLADPSLLEQALLNLAINARDAMPRGGRLSVRSRVVALTRAELERVGGQGDPGPHVEFRVEDTGEGMDSETLARAKEAFFTTKAPGLGTGLGLATVEEAVRGWSGALVLESSEGRGTTARLLLPALAAAQAPDAAAPPARQRDVCRGERILVVEDESLVRRGIQYLLEEQGYCVQSAADADEALALLSSAREPFDLLLTDVVLPGTSGPELARAARALAPEMPTLFMSAFPREELVARRHIDPTATTLEKPFRADEVRDKVRAVLDERG